MSVDVEGSLKADDDFTDDDDDAEVSAGASPGTAGNVAMARRLAGGRCRAANASAAADAPEQRGTLVSRSARAAPPTHLDTTAIDRAIGAVKVVAVTVTKKAGAGSAPASLLAPLRPRPRLLGSANAAQEAVLTRAQA
jgi:hypothetical protein